MKVARSLCAPSSGAFLPWERKRAFLVPGSNEGYAVRIRTEKALGFAQLPFSLHIQRERGKEKMTERERERTMLRSFGNITKRAVM